MIFNEYIKKLILFKIMVLFLLIIGMTFNHSSILMTTFADDGGKQFPSVTTYKIGTVIASDEMMKWEVVDVDENNNYLLVTKNIIDVREYSKEPSNYRNSKIRYYLNKEFYEKRFTDEERSRIVEKEIVSIVNIEDRTLPIESIKTKDKIFLLSKDEVQKYYIREMEIKNNSYVRNLTNKSYDMNFWLRDTYGDLEHAASVKKSTIIKMRQRDNNGIVVAMWYNFSDIYSGNDKQYLVDNTEKADEKLIIDRSGGKKRKIDFDTDEYADDATFSDKHSLNSFDSVTFGSYKDSNNKLKDIKWYISSFDGEDMTLITNKIIEYKEIDYDIYDKTLLNKSPYEHSKIKKYLNENLVKKMFNDEERALLKEMGNNEYMSMPRLDDVFRLDLLNELKNKNIILNDKVNKIYNIAASRYFINDFYEEDGMPHPVTIVFEDNGSNTLGYSNRNKNSDMKIYDICSGLRPIIKVNLKELANYYQTKIDNMKKNNQDTDFNMSSKYEVYESRLNNLKDGVYADSDKIHFKDKIKIGKYEQDGNVKNGKEDIGWVAVKKYNGYYLLMADKVLDAIDVSTEISINDYQDSVLYSFSNYDFLNAAFNDYEKSILKVVKTYSDTGNISEKDMQKANGEVIVLTELPIYGKVFSLSFRLGLENNDLLYGDITKAEPTKYVKDKYEDLNSYLKQDLDNNSIKTTNGDKRIHYMQIAFDGSYNTLKKNHAGFRPMICVSEEDLLKLLNDYD